MTQYRQPGGRFPSQRPMFPDGYLQGGYFDKEGNILPEVIQKWPEQLAQTFRREGLTSTQLRRFFNRIRAIEQQALRFERMKEGILSLIPIAAAAVGRGTAPEVFKQFIDKNVHLAVNSQDSFSRGFMTHFQSVVAYLKYYENLPRGGRG